MAAARGSHGLSSHRHQSISLISDGRSASNRRLRRKDMPLAARINCLAMQHRGVDHAAGSALLESIIAASLPRRGASTGGGMIQPCGCAPSPPATAPASMLTIDIGMRQLDARSSRARPGAESFLVVVPLAPVLLKRRDSARFQSRMKHAERQRPTHGVDPVVERCQWHKHAVQAPCCASSRRACGRCPAL